MEKSRSSSERPVILAYFIYGDRPEYQAEAAFSIATARRHLGQHGPHVEIVVITDQVDFARPIAARRITVAAEELARWTAHGRYNHRAKLGALARLLEEDARAVALVDTDTYFVADPRRLFERVNEAQCVMHAREGRLGDDSEWLPVFRDAATTARVAAEGCSPETEMFNSGVIALAHAQKSLARDALSWLDSEIDNIRAFNLEQVAVSVAFQRACRVVASDDLLVHYWGHPRPFIHVQIDAALRANSSDVDGFGIPKARIRHRLQSRVVAAMWRWSDECRFAYQAALSALSPARSGASYASAWAETAVSAIERIRDVSGVQPRNVRGLAMHLRTFAEAGVMTTKLRARWDRLW